MLTEAGVDDHRPNTVALENLGSACTSSVLRKLMAVLRRLPAVSSVHEESRLEDSILGMLGQGLGVAARLGVDPTVNRDPEWMAGWDTWAESSDGGQKSRGSRHLYSLLSPQCQ